MTKTRPYFLVLACARALARALPLIAAISASAAHPLQAAVLRAPGQISATALALPAPAEVNRSSWRNLTDARLLRDLPGLFRPDVKAWEASGLQALKRSLDRTKLELEFLASVTPEQQAEHIRAAILLQAQSTTRESRLSTLKTENLPSKIQKTAALISQIRDLRLLEPWLFQDEQGTLFHELSLAETRLSRRLSRWSAVLIRNKIGALSESSTEWQGRTALATLEDGSILAFKGHKEAASAQEEGIKMARARHIGIEAPIPLSGKLETQYDTSYDKKRISRGHRVHEHFLPYLIPSDLAEGYRTYLNDKLPNGLSMDQKAKKIQTAAFRSIDQMHLLLANGQVHRSLLSLSHEGVDWEWDFWRWGYPTFGGLRYGPSHISDGLSKFKYPNLRHSGLADFEHLEPLSAFPKRHMHQGTGIKNLKEIPKRHRGNQDFHEHDVYSYGLGQNLTEWALTVLHSGKVNGLSHEHTVAILVGGLRRYMEGLLPPWADTQLDEGGLTRALRSTSRRLRIRSQLLGGVNGWVLHPMIMEGIKPLVELLRTYAVAGGPVLAHPNASPWRYPQNVMFFLIVPAGLIFPVVFFAFPLNVLLWMLVPLLSVQVQYAVYSAISWLPLGVGFFGVALMPLRLIVQVIAPAIASFRRRAT